MNNGVATPYTASFIIFRDGDKVAFVLRSGTSWMNGYYGLPAGKVDQGESFEQAALREAKEETGVDIEPQNLRHLLTVHRKSEDSIWVDCIFEALIWDGELYNAEPHMHSSLEWFNPKELPKNTIPAVRFYLEQIKAGNAYAEYGW